MPLKHDGFVLKNGHFFCNSRYGHIMEILAGGTDAVTTQAIFLSPTHLQPSMDLNHLTLVLVVGSWPSRLHSWLRWRQSRATAARSNTGRVCV